MSRDDNMLASALWLVAGGAAGYAAGRFVVGPLLADRSKVPSASSSTAVAALSPQRPGVRATRALVAGPSGAMQPIDPYGPVNDVAAPPTGPSGDMRPIDPYAEPAPVTITAPPTTTKVTPPPLDGPVTRPPELPIVSPNTIGPITRPTEAPSGPSSISSGPITSPSQVDAVRPTEPIAPVKPATSSEIAPRAAFATKPRVRRFDAVYERYRGDLPIEYVRALVERESDGHPAVRTGSAVGLMQIVPIVLADYNKRHGKAIRGEQLVAPAVNVAIGCELLRLIVASYRKHHPRLASLQADWDNPRFVELLTFGWNAGYSEAGGLGRVARYLEQLGARDIDVDQVAAHARLAGATKHLSNPAKLAWSKSVAALYQRERALARAVFV